MKRWLKRCFILSLICLGPQLRAQYMVLDLQSIIQEELLNHVANGQLSTLGNLLGINTQTLQQAQNINSVLGTPGSLNSLLSNTGINDIQGILNQIPGMQGVNLSSIFPPNVMG